MNHRLMQYLMQGLIDRLDCLLEKPKHVLWIQESISSPLNALFDSLDMSVTVLSLEESLALKPESKYDAIVLAAALWDVAQAPDVLSQLTQRMFPCASFFYGFYALDTAKEYLQLLADKGFPEMNPFLDMHDMADIVMAENITDVVSDNDTIQLPALPIQEWEGELKTASVLPVIQWFAQSHEIDLPDVSTLWPSAKSAATTIEMGFVHGVYRPKSKTTEPGVHTISLDAIGGRRS